MTLEFLQHYWFIVIATLGGLLVFLMFVQGANTQLIHKGLTSTQRRMIVNSTGRKWELAFTCLVTFGGAFFASFPLFYSTSFGGAYWVWVLLLVTFVFQAVSYEFQNKKENLLGSRTFQWFLALNGLLAPLLIGTAVGTFFTGSDFSVDKMAMAQNISPTISVWGNSWHGLEAVPTPALFLGLTVMFLDMCLGSLYIINNIDDEATLALTRKSLRWQSLLFLASLVAWLAFLFTMEGYAVAEDGTVFFAAGKYLRNLLQMPVVAALFLLGAFMVVVGIWQGIFTRSVRGIWPAGMGTVLVVVALFIVAGFNGTAYYPSYSNLQSSLTITNSSSSLFTLKTMFFISLLVPFVVAYIAFVWRKMDQKPITPDEIQGSEDKY
ncbi:MAG: cytochrome d ubiquinol oxidase subunit II [Bacteroidales bacterium]|nr:cytochrome d ubiquinol oxidase subunit II [Bacteroidales bacterium]